MPPASVEAYRTSTSSEDVEMVDYPGDRGVMMQHVGMLVGANAHARVWPRIADWLRQQQNSLPRRGKVA